MYPEMQIASDAQEEKAVLPEAYSKSERQCLRESTMETTIVLILNILKNNECILQPSG